MYSTFISRYYVFDPLRLLMWEFHSFLSALFGDQTGPVEYSRCKSTLDYDKIDSQFARAIFNLILNVDAAIK